MNLKHLSQSFAYKVTRNAGDESIFLSLPEWCWTAGDYWSLSH